MTKFFRKPLSELILADIEELISERYREDSRLEYKGELPTQRGEHDGWMTGGNLGSYARDKILREVVAFANSFGGFMVLGVGEDPGDPHRPSEVRPIPRCAELAYRLRLMARDCIDPKIPMLDSIGISSCDEGAGIVVLHVARSSLAPHRLETGERHCYIRRSDRSEAMTMREIQDLTLRTSRGTDHLDDLFREQSESLSKWMVRESFPRPAGFRVTFAPVWPLGEVRVHRNDTLFPPMVKTLARSGSHELEIGLPGSLHECRPIVRGSLRFSQSERRRVAQLLTDSGWGEIRFAHSRFEEHRASLYPTWILGAHYNALRMINAYREGVGAPEAEYALDWELFDHRGEVVLGSWHNGQDFIGTIELPLRFPRLSVGDPSEFNSILHCVYEDLLHAAATTFLKDDEPLIWDFE